MPNEPSKEHAGKSLVRDRAPSWRVVALVSLWLVVVGLLAYWWTSQTIGMGVATVLSAMSLLVASTLSGLGYVVFGRAPTFHRIQVAIVGSLVLAAPVLCFRVEGFTGGMVPRLQPRWAPRAELPASDLPACGGIDRVDLTVTTGDDYPQFLGPDRNLTVPNVSFDANWSAVPPECVWRQPIGAGWSSFATVNGYAVTQEQRDELELVTCYRISDAKLMWANTLTARHETVMGGIGPRATPTIHEGRVYALSATGVFQCIDGTDGETLWKADLLDLGQIEDDSQRLAWGRANSPLIVDELVVLPLGGSSSLIAFDKVTGEVSWRGGHRQIGYSSPILAELSGKRQIIAVLEDHVCGHDPQTGEELWASPWPGSSTADANNSNPVVVDSSHVFVSKGYGQGSSLIRIAQSEDGTWVCEVVWENPTRMKTKMTNVVLHQGYIYGMDDSILQCLDPRTGKSMWKRGRYNYSQLLLAGNTLLVLTETGDVVAVTATADKFDELGRFQAIEGKTWNSPALHGRYLVVRNAREAACYRLPNFAR